MQSSTLHLAISVMQLAIKYRAATHDVTTVVKLLPWSKTTVAGSWNFLSYFPVVSQLFLISQLFLTYFPKISQLFLSYFPFLTYFPSISHFSLVSHLFLNYFLISHLFPKYFSLVSQLFLSYVLIVFAFATLFLLVCFCIVSKYVN